MSTMFEQWNLIHHSRKNKNQRVSSSIFLDNDKIYIKYTMPVSNLELDLAAARNMANALLIQCCEIEEEALKTSPKCYEK